MKLGRRKGMFSLLMLSLIFSLCVKNVMAADMQMVEQTEQIESNEQKESNGEIAIRLFVPHLSEGERLQVTKESSLDMYGIDYFTYDVAKSLIIHQDHVTNDMISGYDSTVLGEQNVTVTADGVETVLRIEVIDGQAPGEIKSIRVDKEKQNILIPQYTNKDYLEIPAIYFYDALDREAAGLISGMLADKDMLSDVDTSKLGIQNATLTYKGMQASFTYEVVEVKAITATQSIPVGGTINDWQQFYLVDSSNEKNILLHAELYNLSGFPGSWLGEYDSTKAGIQNVPYEINMWGQKFRGNLELKVGIPDAKTIDEIFSANAQATMPSGEAVGAFEVPSGDLGAGTWIFQTGLPSGSSVNVWSFHEENWLNIGSYIVDGEGNVTVQFTANQLSPILLVKDSDVAAPNSNKDVNTVTSDTTTDNTNKNTPKTDDETDVPLYGGLVICIGTLLIFLRKVMK